MRPSDMKGGASFLWKGERCLWTCNLTVLRSPFLDFNLQFFSPPTRRRTPPLAVVAVFMWVEGRWCNVAWGRRSGQSCWTLYSCSPLQTEAPGRPGPAAWRRAGVGGRQLVEPGRRGVGVGKNLSAPPWMWTDVIDDHVVGGGHKKKLKSKSN